MLNTLSVRASVIDWQGSVVQLRCSLDYVEGGLGTVWVLSLSCQLGKIPYPQKNPER